MKKAIILLLSALAILPLLNSCGKSTGTDGAKTEKTSKQKGEMGADPLTDGQQMMLKVLQNLADNNREEANKIMGDYCSMYADAPLSERVMFLAGCSPKYWAYVRDETTPDKQWQEFLDEITPLMDKLGESGVEQIGSLSNGYRIDVMYKATKSEARDKGCWWPDGVD